MRQRYDTFIVLQSIPIMLAQFFRNSVSRTAISLLLLASITACSDTTVGSKSFTESETFTVPSIAAATGLNLVLPLTIEDIQWPVNLAEQEAYSDGDFDYVTSVKVRDITFEITEQSNTGTDEDGNLDSFEFVSSLDLSLKATVDGTETIVPIADLPISDPQIASNTTTLAMNVNSDQDIRDMIEAPGGSIILISISGNSPPDNVNIRASIRFRVGVGFR